MALINHVEWTKMCALCKGEFPLSASYGACVKCVQNILSVRKNGERSDE